MAAVNQAPKENAVRRKYMAKVHAKDFEGALEIAKPHRDKFSALILAINNNAGSLCSRLLDQGWDINRPRNRDGVTALHVAAITKNYQLVTLLLQRGAKAGATDMFGNTPLMSCLRVKQDRMGRDICLLLAENMSQEDVWVRNDFGETLLHIMSRNTSVPYRFYRWAITKNVNVNARDEFVGRHFFVDMLVYLNKETLMINVGKLAVQYGMNVNHVDNFGTSIIHRVCLEKKVKVLKWLLDECDVTVGAANADGQTAMLWAVKKGCMPAIKLLYAAGEGFKGKARQFPGRARKTFYEIARKQGQRHIGRRVEEELKGELIDGLRVVKPLCKIAKEVIREQLVLDGKDIRPKVNSLELPGRLKNYLVTLDWAD